MRLTDFKVLSLGCYGTLIDRDSGIYTALRHLLEGGHVTLAREDVLAAFNRHEAAQQAQTPEMPYSAVLAQVHRRMASEWGVLASDDDHALFGTSVPQWPVFVDTPAALQYLKRYYKLVVLSNADHASFAASSRKLEVRFDEVVMAEDVGSCKPTLANFRRMVSCVGKLGFERHQILHAARSPARDLVPAASCGLATAWIDRVPDELSGDAKVAPGPPAEGVRCEFRFADLVGMVRAHQEELRA